MGLPRRARGVVCNAWLLGVVVSTSAVVVRLAGQYGTSVISFYDSPYICVKKSYRMCLLLFSRVHNEYRKQRYRREASKQAAHWLQKTAAKTKIS